MSKLTIMAVGAHPDDIELAIAGTLIMHSKAGDSIVLVDLTEGELGSRGTVEDRQNEAITAAQLIGVDARINLGLPDGNVSIDEHSKMLMIETIREYKPDILIIPARHDRHPDHGNGHALCKETFFLSGLSKIVTEPDAWRPKLLLSYTQQEWIEPDMIIDISEYYDQKIKTIEAYESQFYQENDEGQTPTLISTEDYWKAIEARSRTLGHRIGATFGEGLCVEDTVPLKNLQGLYLPALS